MGNPAAGLVQEQDFQILSEKQRFWASRRGGDEPTEYPELERNQKDQ